MLCHYIYYLLLFRYIIQYECSNPDTDAVLDARKSFPSLEAAFSVYNTIVILVRYYLCFVVHYKDNYIIRTLSEQGFELLITLPYIYVLSP